MQAMLLQKQQKIERSPLVLSEVEKPKIEADELLIKVEACGVCRTDLHVIEGDLPPKAMPIIPGHQVVGFVEEIGSACKDFFIGDKVGIAWLGSTCQQCSFCKEGRENLCESSIYNGYMQHGGYAQYCKGKEKFIYHLEETMDSYHVAPLLCAGIIGYRAYKQAKVKPKSTLAIFGFGSSAHLTIQVALHYGVRVFVATKSEHHQKMAKEMGAIWVGNSEDPLPEKVDSAIVFAPAGEVVPFALRSIEKGGSVAIAGIHMTAIPELDYEKELFHEKNLCSVEANTREDGLEFLQLAKSIPIKTKIKIYPLKEANEALQELKQHKLEGSAVLKI